MDTFTEGTPLHYYLSRTSNLQLDTVKMLVDLCPESLKLSGSEQSYFPIHSIIENPKVGSYHEVVQYLVDTEPTILQNKDRYGWLPLHTICRRSNTTADLVQILIESFQDAIKEADLNGCLPIHHLCENVEMKEEKKLGILRILIDAYPKALRSRTRAMVMSLSLPIHLAPRYQGPAFCKILAHGYPGSLAIGDGYGYLPFHLACQNGSPETVKYLYEADRESINKRTRADDLHPIHMALERDSEIDQFEITKFLLRCDPDCAAAALPNYHRLAGCLPFYLACDRGAYLETVQLLFDVYPAAIYTEEGSTKFISIPSAAERSRSIAGFLRRQMYDITRFCNNTDLAFPLPHHRAVKSDVTLGVFKLLVEKLPQNEHECDNEGKTTLHLACEYGKIGIVRYLIQISKGVVSVPDCDGNYPLHLACREGYCDIINSLLEANTVSVSIQNSGKKLPIELLIESDCDQDSLVYTEAVWRLLVASPSTI